MTLAGHVESSTRQRADGCWEHVFAYNAKPFTLNQANQKRWAWIEARQEWRSVFQAMALGCAPLASCHVHVKHLLGTRRKVDVGACMPSVKAAVDGIVLAGVLEDDGPAFVTGMTFQAPVFAGRDALIVELVGFERQVF